MIKTLITLFILPVTIFAHSLIFDAFNNEDGTMEITAMFSTGASAQGATVKIISLATLETIHKKRVGKTGTIIVNIPKEAYKLILDSGPGHKVEKIGTIQPIGGFTIVSQKKINYALYTTLVLSLLFCISAIILYIKRLKR